MRRSPVTVLAVALVAITVLLIEPGPALAQDTPSTGVPAPDIVPEPNSGHEPTEAGDRGGALQLLLLGLVVVAVGGAVVHLSRQSRRARSRTR
jgi:hypothetical protein